MKFTETTKEEAIKIIRDKVDQRFGEDWNARKDDITLWVVQYASHAYEQGNRAGTADTMVSLIREMIGGSDAADIGAFIRRPHAGRGGSPSGDSAGETDSGGAGVSTEPHTKADRRTRYPLAETGEELRPTREVSGETGPGASESGGLSEQVHNAQE